MQKLFLISFLGATLILTACVQSPVFKAEAPANDSVQAQPDGLEPRPSHLDEVSAAFALDLSGAKIYVAPVQIEYSKRFSSLPRSNYREKDYELDQRDLQRLNSLLAKTFSAKFLSARNGELVPEQAEADYTLAMSLEKFSVAAPLDPSPWAWRVYTEQSAYGVLVGTLFDRDGNAVMHFRDRRDIGENFGSTGPGGRLERFTSVTFWSDMRVDMRRAFASLDKSLL
ncbi:hypothetical protein [Microbulbifer sp. GL-2]|uniref:hypothetical protein n=1 Tax=Microbulbifer sp. GL-2 TaxID=2591606 RepID=UPI0011646B5C|nr:hypothetical protein [Microbulbifer sp. GL-2]BBM01718.1 hypothetical protein GL2_17920 [Microbulbifer sp. GL-2]